MVNDNMNIVVKKPDWSFIKVKLGPKCAVTDQLEISYYAVINKGADQTV